MKAARLRRTEHDETAAWLMVKLSETLQRIAGSSFGCSPKMVGPDEAKMEEAAPAGQGKAAPHPKGLARAELLSSTSPSVTTAAIVAEMRLRAAEGRLAPTTTSSSEGAGARAPQKRVKQGRHHPRQNAEFETDLGNQDVITTWCITTFGFDLSTQLLTDNIFKIESSTHAKLRI